MNDNMPKVEIISRTVDEIEILLRDYMSEMKARRATIGIIPIIGKLVRDVMNDTAETIMREIERR